MSLLCGTYGFREREANSGNAPTCLAVLGLTDGIDFWTGALCVTEYSVV